ncbi:MAG: GTP-binding protein HflX [Bacillota bacterium]|nr:MAG: GTP-binding protein HflX [Bacillota bacterium]
MHIVERGLEEKAVLFVVSRSHSAEIDALLDELQSLTETAGAEVLGRMVQLKDNPDPATYFGRGKVQELKALCEQLSCNIAICDDELSPSQLRNLEKELEIKVADRTQVILDIFSQRATSAEGKLQVESAQLAYMMPRLRGRGVEMSNPGAGIRTRGPGETKLEYDRRRIKSRMADLREQIDELSQHRSLLRHDRMIRGVPTVALVGYTNAGKSSLLNALTEGGAVAHNKLFATLDPTARELLLPDKRRVMIVDTVGFVRKLPHHLVTAFRATLEEVKFADVLIHVVDVSHEEAEEQARAVEQVLSELGALEKSIVLALNKVDKVEDCPIIAARGEAIPVSAELGTNLARLIEAVANALADKPQRYSLHVPFSRGDLLVILHEKGDVHSVDYTESGTDIVVDILPKYANKVEAELRKV